MSHSKYQLISKENPDQYMCPLTLDYMVDPVQATDGYIYERNAITHWCLLHGTSPFTRQSIQIDHFNTRINLCIQI